MMLLCVMLRWSIAMVPPVADAAATDPCMRSPVRLSAAACNYLRSETWGEAHPRAKYERKGDRFVRRVRR